MRVEALKLSANLTAKLRQAGLHSAADVLAAGREGLEAIDGIGPKTAAEVLTAAQQAQAATQADRQATQDAGAAAAHGSAAPEGAGAPSGLPAPAEPDPDALVTVRNVSAEIVLVGERYLLPTQTRTVRRRLLRSVPAGKLVEV